MLSDLLKVSYQRNGGTLARICTQYFDIDSSFQTSMISTLAYTLLHQTKSLSESIKQFILTFL